MPEHRDPQITSEALLRALPGGSDLLEWFGYAPAFHDATLSDIVFATRGRSALVLHAHRITDRLDDRGHYILDKHVEVTIELTGVKRIDLVSFRESAAVFHLEITRHEEDYAIEWSSSIGVEGLIVASGLSLHIRPGDVLRSADQGRNP
jgi:hypothetical protein